jgi:hypothetical protein
MLWIPKSPGTPEPLVYEVEVVDVVAPPKVANRTDADNDAKGDKGAERDSAATPRVEGGAPAASRSGQPSH